MTKTTQTQTKWQWNDETGEWVQFEVEVDMTVDAKTIEALKRRMPHLLLPGMTMDEGRVRALAAWDEAAWGPRPLEVPISLNGKPVVGPKGEHPQARVSLHPHPHVVLTTASGNRINKPSDWVMSPARWWLPESFFQK